MGTQALAQGPWQVIRLHPPGIYDSQAAAAAGGFQGGVVSDNAGYTFPALWNGSAGSYVNMLPPGGPYQIGNIYGMSGNRQVGRVISTTSLDAALWSGTPESLVSLSPNDSRYTGTEAHGVAGNQQVGLANFRVTGGSRSHACVWNGSAASFVDLHPAVGRYSSATATDGLWQGGFVQLTSGGSHAALWKGSAASFIDLNPSWADAGSSIGGMADGVQVGAADSFSTSPRAMLWRGTVESAVDMTPTGARSAVLYGTTGKMHVGYSQYSGMAEAGIWLSNDPNSFVNLHALLGSDWSSGSNAYAISVHDGLIDVVGTAAPIGGRAEAILWRALIPAPATSGVLCCGMIFAVNRRRR